MKNIHKTATWLIAGGLLLALGMALSFWTFTQMEEAAAARKQTFFVLNNANQLLSALKDAETGQRGYALTGDETFLQPYLAVRNNISSDLNKLRQLTSIPAAQKHLDAMALLIDAKLAELSQVIDLRRLHDMPAVMATVKNGQGKRLMDQIRTEMTSFIQIEQDALVQRDARFQSNMRHLFTLIVTASLLVLLLAVAFAYLVYRQTQQRLKNLVHLETLHLLEIQEQTNKQLQQANIAILLSEESLAVTLNSIGDGVIATDAREYVIRMNPVAEQLTGWTQAEAIGQPIGKVFNIVHQETRQPVTIPITEALTSGTIQGLANHTVLIARDGSERDIADSCAPIRDRDDRVIGAVLVFRDVSEEYKAQQMLRDSAALVRTILNTAIDSFISIHIYDGIRGGIIETVNLSTEENVWLYHRRTGGTKLQHADTRA